MIRPSLHVIGLGVKIPDHTTQEALEAISACKIIYSIVQEPPHVWMPARTEGQIPVINVLPMYKENDLRRDNYEKVANAVISALTDFSPVGYVTYGNPLVYDSVSQHLVRFAKDSGTHLRIVAGLSSIDALLCDLGIDMAPGLQVLDATWAVAAKIVAQTDLALVLLQLGAFGSLRTHYQVMPPASALHDLITYLSGFYPSSHEVFLVQSADRAGHP